MGFDPTVIAGHSNSFFNIFAPAMNYTWGLGVAGFVFLLVVSLIMRK